MDEDFLIGGGGVKLPQTSYKSRLTQQSDAIEALASKAIDIAKKEAEQKQECSTLQISSSMSSKLVEDLCQKNPLFKKTCNEIALEKKLINLQLLAYIQDVPSKSIYDLLSDWITLGNKINRVTAIQLISNLPVSLKVDKLDTSLNEEKSLEKCKFTVLLYKLISEAAFCRRLFKNNLKKDNLYQDWKLYANSLSKPDENNPIEQKNIKGFFNIISF